MYPPGLCLPTREEEGVDCLASRRSLTLKNAILIYMPVRVKSVSWKLHREGRLLKHPMNIKVGGEEKELIKDWSELKLQGQFKRVREPIEWFLRTEKVGKRDVRAQLCSSDRELRSRNRLAMCGDSDKNVQVAFPMQIFQSWHILITWFIAELSKRTQRSAMGKKIWLSMHPRNFGSYKVVCTYVHPFIQARVKFCISNTRFRRVRVRGSNAG